MLRTEYIRDVKPTSVEILAKQKVENINECWRIMAVSDTMRDPAVSSIT